MKDFTEQQLAQQLLDQKHLGGQTPPWPKKAKLRIFIIHGILLTIAIVLQNVEPDNPTTWLIIGVLLGNWTIILKFQKLAVTRFPFFNKIFDWDRISQIAKQSPPPPPAAKP